VNPYAAIADLYVYGAPQTAFGSLPVSTLQAQLDAAAARVDTNVGGRYVVPLTPPIPPVVTQMTCKLAAFELIANSRGFNPANPGDQALSTSYIEALKWLADIQHQRAHLVGQAQTGSTAMPQPVVISSSVTFLNTGASGPNRGW
jgi:phage gp36-like protein